MLRFSFVIAFLITQLTVSAQYWMQFGGGITIDEGTDIAIDSANKTYTTGYYTTTATFGTFSISSAGLSDIFIVKTNPAGVISWLKTAGGSNLDKANAITCDISGNVIVTGYFHDSAFFDTQKIISKGQQDIFIVKYSASGNLLWATSAGGTGNDIGNDVCTDLNGNVIITGEFSDSCIFGPANSLKSMNGSIDVFTAKYDSNGNVLWAKKGSGNSTDRGIAIACDANGLIYVSGMFSDTVTFDAQHPNTMSNSIFLINYDASGNEQWFRYAGSSSNCNLGGMSLKGNSICMTGNYNGTLFFLGGPSTQQLPSVNTNNLFVCRYDLNGNYIWSNGNGSVSNIESTSISIKSNGNVVIGGNYNCRFTDYSALYGSGIFCSIGYSDCFVAEYDNASNLLWARNFGGKQNDYLKSIAVNSNNQISTTGSFNDYLNSTYNPSNYFGYSTVNVNAGIPVYCADSNYNKYVRKQSSGNSDVFINSNIDLSREPYDFFYRTGTICDRPFDPLCISQNYSGNTLICNDSATGCSSVNLYAIPNTMQTTAFQYIYSWSNLNQGPSNNVNAPGNYSLIATTEDLCFTQSHSINVSIDYPVVPTISDSKGINVNTSTPVIINLCSPDSVYLWCTNVGNNTVKWQGYPVGKDTIKVTTQGTYSVTLTTPAGCAATIYVTVNVGTAIQTTKPAMTCPSDTDHNDSLRFCANESFIMHIYDTLSNPNNNNIIYPQSPVVHWTCTPSVTTFAPTSFTNPINNNFSGYIPGSYNLTIEAWVVRINPCDTDSVFCSKQIFIQVDSVPYMSYNMSIIGSNYLCPGDSVMLVAQGAPGYNWSTGSTNDTIYVSTPGYYSVNYSTVISNQYGCTSVAYGSAATTITYYPQPNVTTFPSGGIICPNDSLMLVCSGTGTFNWQGPNGQLPYTTSTAWAATPGNYYCVQTPSPGCNLISNTVQLAQYSAPFLLADPGPYLCSNTSVNLNVVGNSGATIQWLPPLTGSNPVQTISAPGLYQCNVTACNITTLLNINILEGITPPSVFDYQVCYGDSVLINNTYYSSDISFNDTLINAYGCDSVLTYNVNILPLIVDSADLIICAGDSIAVGNHYYSVSGNYLDTLNSVSGCDSVIHTSLAVLPSSINNQQFSICPGDTLFVGNSAYTTAGIYSDTLQAINGCDSIISTILLQGNSITLSQSFSICSGDSILVGNNYYSQAGVYTDTIQSATSCDSVLTTTIYINQNFTQVQQQICYGDSTLFNGVYISNAGTYTDTLITLNGCDSVVQFSLAIYPEINFTVTCDSLLCSGDSVIINANGNYLYSWSPATFLNATTGSTVICAPTTSMQYIATATDASGCTTSQPVFVTTLQNPIADFTYSIDSSNCINKVIMQNASVNATGYYWNFGNGNYSAEENPIENFQPGNYNIWLTANSDEGCKDSTVKSITISDETFFLHIPNVFTPNGDGLNDYFIPKFKCIESMQTKIMNRWGVVVYSSTQVAFEWNGKSAKNLCPDGVYYYLVSCTDFSGNAYKYSGTVTLIR